MVAVAIGATAVAGIGSAVVGSKAAKKAANAQVQSDAAAIAEQQRQFDITQKNLAPWYQAGGQAIGQGYAMLQPGYDYTASPGYQWRLGQGTAAIEGGAAARGHLLSGGTLKDLANYGQGLAANDYNDQFNRLMAISGGGQQAATSLGGFGANAASNIGSLLAAQGQARASGYQNQAGAINTGLGNIATLGNLYGGGGGFGGGLFSQPSVFRSYNYANDVNNVLPSNFGA